MALRWKRQPNEKGLARVCQGPRGWYLYDGKEIVMRVASLSRGFNKFDITGWYFYGCGHNSCAMPCDTEGEAQAQAKEFYLKNKKESS